MGEAREARSQKREARSEKPTNDERRPGAGVRRARARTLSDLRQIRQVEVPATLLLFIVVEALDLDDAGALGAGALLELLARGDLLVVVEHDQQAALVLVGDHLRGAAAGERLGGRG